MNQTFTLVSQINNLEKKLATISVNMVGRSKERRDEIHDSLTKNGWILRKGGVFSEIEGVCFYSMLIKEFDGKSHEYLYETI